jgi:hypothetical protein
MLWEMRNKAIALCGRFFVVVTNRQAWSVTTPTTGLNSGRPPKVDLGQVPPISGCCRDQSVSVVGDNTDHRIKQWEPQGIS